MTAYQIRSHNIISLADTLGHGNWLLIYMPLPASPVMLVHRIRAIYTILICDNVSSYHVNRPSHGNSLHAVRRKCACGHCGWQGFLAACDILLDYDCCCKCYYFDYKEGRQYSRMSNQCRTAATLYRSLLLRMSNVRHRKLHCYLLGRTLCYKLMSTYFIAYLV